ncbi:class I SAM-dependent DNA methyltransferase [Vibrio hippocampi]|nr:class I SAM-dependent methyltransferase [Vibrio hippocampi]
MSNQWDECAATWEGNSATADFARACFRHLQQTTKLSGKIVLDFGCGTGLLSQHMASKVKQVVALDSSEAMIEELEKKGLDNVEPVVDSLTRGLIAQHPAFRPQFDIVVASSVCGFVPNLQETVNLIYTLLDEYGVFVHWDWLAQEGDETGLTLEQSQLTLEKAGFSEVVVTTPFSIKTEFGEQAVLMGVARK